jgi:hypothetical protein
MRSAVADVFSVDRVSVVAGIPFYDYHSGFLLAILLLLAFLNVAGVLLLLTILDVVRLPVIGEFLLLLAFLYVDGILLLLSLLNVARMLLASPLLQSFSFAGILLQLRFLDVASVEFLLMLTILVFCWLSCCCWRFWMLLADCCC